MMKVLEISLIVVVIATYITAFPTRLQNDATNKAISSENTVPKVSEFKKDDREDTAEKFHQVNGELSVEDHDNIYRKRNIKKRNSLEEIIHRHNLNVNKKNIREGIKSAIERQLKVKNGSTSNDNDDHERLTVESLSKKFRTKKICVPVDKEGIMVKHGKEEHFFSVEFIRENIYKDIDGIRCKEEKKVDVVVNEAAPKIEEIDIEANKVEQKSIEFLLPPSIPSEVTKVELLLYVNNKQNNGRKRSVMGKRFGRNAFEGQKHRKAHRKRNITVKIYGPRAPSMVHYSMTHNSKSYGKRSNKNSNRQSEPQGNNAMVKRRSNDYAYNRQQYLTSTKTPSKPTRTYTTKVQHNSSTKPTTASKEAKNDEDTSEYELLIMSSISTSHQRAWINITLPSDYIGNLLKLKYHKLKLIIDCHKCNIQQKNNREQTDLIQKKNPNKRNVPNKWNRRYPRQEKLKLRQSKSSTKTKNINNKSTRNFYKNRINNDRKNNRNNNNKNNNMNNRKNNTNKKIDKSYTKSVFRRDKVLSKRNSNNPLNNMNNKKNKKNNNNNNKKKINISAPRLIIYTKKLIYN